MNKALVVALALLMVGVIAGGAEADADHWRLWVAADDGADWYHSDILFGCWSATTDGYDDGYDVQAWLDFDPSRMWPWFTTVVENEIYVTDIRSLPAPSKTFEIRVFAGPSAAYGTIRLQWGLIADPIMPPAASTHTLKMVDNRGVAGAPANGTVWTMTIPETFTDDPFFTLSLPILKLTSYSNTNAISQGYIMEYNVVVPEPSSLLALVCGSTLLTAGGLVRRRRFGRR